MNEAMKLIGCKVQDKVTGLPGIVTSITFDLYGCIQALVHPGTDKDGRPLDQGWYDVGRLVVLDANPVMPNPHLSAEPAVKGPAEKPILHRA